MTNTNVFLFKDDGDINKHTLLMDQSEEKVSGLIEQGKGVSVDLSNYETFRTQAKHLYETFKDDERQIKETDNPLFTDEVKAYELNKLQEKLEQESQVIEADYQEYLSETIVDARTRSAQATIKVTEEDERTAKQVLNRFNLELTVTNKDKQAATVNGIVDQLSMLTSEQKTAMQGDILTLLANLTDEASKRRIIEEVQDVRNMEAFSLKAAEQLPISVTDEINIERIIRNKDKQ